MCRNPCYCLSRACELDLKSDTAKQGLITVGWLAGKMYLFTMHEAPCQGCRTSPEPFFTLKWLCVSYIGSREAFLDWK